MMLRLLGFTHRIIAMIRLGRTATTRFVVTRRVHHSHRILLRHHPQNQRLLHHLYHPLHLHHRIHLPLNQSPPNLYLVSRYRAKKITRTRMIPAMLGTASRT